jgi:hypothetical protein
MNSEKNSESFNFTASFKNTVQKFDNLSEGKKADFNRSSQQSQDSDSSQNRAKLVATAEQD